MKFHVLPFVLLGHLLSAPALAQSAAALARVDAADLSIAKARSRAYPGSALKVVRTLNAGVNYSRQVVSYQSEGLTIYALLTVPAGPPPKGGWPAIV